MTNRNVEWTDNVWDKYIYWQTQDKKIIKRINTLIKECQRTPFEGTGKPESLKANLSGFWSRRIDEKHRLVYEVTDERISIRERSKFCVSRIG
ncbi:Txe/YoeB family addiction module toxin [Acinetobacter indicus]|uniref:Txe/YoeB family addiction module toxin n=1 Tax=Acinetobacter indicus TaxID=756892 RepID=UPI0013B080FA|nr:Txe/YoeB family addiction module toxin [Acinetobacter indicus]QIC80222.1 Txe/YoeB family addiction module toxin [Acinetobacter indicus]